MESRLREQPKERDIQAQGLAHCLLGWPQQGDAARLEMPPTQERQTPCFSGKQTPYP